MESQELIGAEDSVGGKLTCPPLLLGTDGRDTPLSNDLDGLDNAPKHDGTVIVEPGVKVMRGT